MRGGLLKSLVTIEYCSIILKHISLEATVGSCSRPGESCASNCTAYLAKILRSAFIIALMSMKHVLAAAETTSGILLGNVKQKTQSDVIERILLQLKKADIRIETKGLPNAQN